MSKSITITGIYNNNKRNTVGLHDPRNADMVDIKFEASELINKVANAFVNKIFKGFKVLIDISGSSGHIKRIEYDLFTIGDSDIIEAINKVNN